MMARKPLGFWLKVETSNAGLENSRTLYSAPISGSVPTNLCFGTTGQARIFFRTANSLP